MGIQSDISNSAFISWSTITKECSPSGYLKCNFEVCNFEVSRDKKARKFPGKSSLARRCRRNATKITLARRCRRNATRTTLAKNVASKPASVLDGSTIYGNAPVDKILDTQIPVITNLSEPRATNASDNSDGDIEPTCHRSASIVPDEVPCSAHDAADTIMATELDTTSVMHPSKRRRTGISSADLEIYGVTSRNHYNMGLSQYNISDAMTKPLKPNLFLPSRKRAFEGEVLDKPAKRRW